MMPKFSSPLLAVILALGSQDMIRADAFSMGGSGSHSRQLASNKITDTKLHASVEKTGLKAPSDIPMDDVPGMFEKYVQKTYG